MANYLGLTGSVIASVVALTIAILGWRKADQRTVEDAAERRRTSQADKLAKLLELHLEAVASGHLRMNDAKMTAILLTLPGHLAAVLRVRLKLQYTMKGVSLDAGSAARLRPGDTKDAGHKWLIFDRSSVQKGRSFEPRAEWIEAELAYDIAGLHGDDQDAVLKALSHDTRDTNAAVVGMLQAAKENGE